MRKSLLFSALLCGGLCMAQADYSIDWFKVAGGGGTSIGGTYQISGTIGQHDASGSLTGGDYAVTGGFWAIYALQTPGAPLLMAFATTTNTVVVSWSSLSATNFVLQTNVDLATTNWGSSDYLITTNGDMESITITSPPPGNLFFRLKQ